MVFGQVTRSFKAKKDNIKKNFILAKRLALCFKATWFEQIDRRLNQKANELSKAIYEEEIGRILLEPLSRKSIDKEVM